MDPNKKNVENNSFKQNESEKNLEPFQMLNNSNIDSNTINIKYSSSDSGIRKKMVSCLECKKVYFSLSGLRCHMKKCHPSKISSQAQKNNAFKCHCGKNFSHRNNLQFHIYRFHEKIDSQQKVVNCPLCNNIVEREQYFLHCQQIHNIYIQTEQMSFSLYEDFTLWKHNLERVTNTAFIKFSEDIFKKNNLKEIWKCHCSGFYQSPGTGKIPLKTETTCKINGYCPAAIEVLNNKGKFDIIFTKTHVGHDNCHTYLRTQLKKKKIVSTLQEMDPNKNNVENNSLKQNESEKNLEPFQMLNNSNIDSNTINIEYSSSDSGINEKMISCLECKKVYFSPSGLRRHMKICHPSKVSSQAKKTYAFKCPCGKNFSHRNNLQFHIRRFHEKKEPQKKVVFVKCPLCKGTIEKEQYFLHCQQIHDIYIQTEKTSFSLYEDFSLWKHNLERKTNTEFIKIKHVIHKSNNLKQFWRCHRSGFFQSESKGKRRLKKQGSCKLDGFCPAAIEVSKKNGKFDILFIKTHVGHDNDLRHLKIPLEEKQKIASKIASNVPFQDILNEIKNSSGNNTERVHLITRKDLHNIKNNYAPSVQCQNSFIDAEHTYSEKLTEENATLEELIGKNITGEELIEENTTETNDSHVTDNSVVNADEDYKIDGIISDWEKLINKIEKNKQEEEIKKKKMKDDINNVIDDLKGSKQIEEALSLFSQFKQAIQSLKDLEDI